MAGGEGGGASIEYTPTWVVALVCTVIVAISLLAERFLHFAGKLCLKKNQTSLYEALQKIKEELMLMGFISLMLTVFQDRITKTCMRKTWMDHWLPCKKEYAKSTAHFEIEPFSRRLLAAASDANGYCEAKGKVPLLSLQAVHDLHIFIFVLAVTHVVFAVLTFVFGRSKIHQWRHWEDLIQRKEYDPEEAMKTKLTHVHDHAFINKRLSGLNKIGLFRWLKSFFKQFYRSVSILDYSTLRRGFIVNHCKANPKYNFYNWYLWVFVVVFLLLNVYGWHAYFWISFVPLALLLAVGTKLEHIITQLGKEVAQRHTVLTGDLVVRPSDDHFWFHRPRLVLTLIHIILFQNAFEFAIFFWMLSKFGFDSCIMGEVRFIIPRLVIGVFVQFVCSYSTLPLYAIVAQMGSSFNPAIFDDHIQESISVWALKAKKKGPKRAVANYQDSPQQKVEMTEISVQDPPMEQKGKSPEIEPAA